MEPTESQFVSTIERWMIDVKREAITLFREGLAHEHCMNIAMKIVEARDIKRVRDQMRLLPPPAGLLS